MSQVHLAGSKDLEKLLPLVAAFHAGEGVESDEAHLCAALSPLLEGSPHGAIYIAGPRLGPVGYIITGILILGMVMSRMGIAQSYGLFDIVFSGSGDPLPPVFDNAPRAAHGIFATALMALVALHIAAAFYHQIILKDGLLRRMGFGRRPPE